jgi:hypothetical protein
MQMNAITLTTDFGLSDWFVGALKGVIHGINPRATVIDLTHGIPPGDVEAGAFALAAGFRAFPRGTVHVAVVDPGVGSGRPAIAVRTRDYFLVGPDNGVLSLAMARERVVEIRRLENRRMFRAPVSRTFHGRDIFAPVAARLSMGRDWTMVGPVVTSFQRLDWPTVERRGAGLFGTVVYLDRFGKAITNISGQMLAEISSDAAVEVCVGRRRVGVVAECYQAVAAGKPVALIGSTGFLEVAVNGGSAASLLRLQRGSRVSVRTRKRFTR